MKTANWPAHDIPYAFIIAIPPAFPFPMAIKSSRMKNQWHEFDNGHEAPPLDKKESKRGVEEEEENY